MSAQPVARYGKNPGWAVTAILAILYGLGIAFGPQLGGSDAFWERWTMWGSAVVGIAFVLLMVIPFVRWAMGPDRRR
ncbi:hypothetical protein [Arsenicicoccus sp. oral taxon 190]|uniref:hypothetical protein n=1 Tax=Arsenicicoccus sp. oral taxon 190 TaxID=1658671 RepID=UPI00067A1BC4|nr:hypothetical protein [Arsenicicoccus sp. oral taxon 190]AKT51912.1 hypothetical protein ADJ73_12640 [Arsenicicoccus sp. oral taxon 190]